MNSALEQAALYRKAAETIEMCADHGIEPMVKHCGVTGLNYLANGSNIRAVADSD